MLKSVITGRLCSDPTTAEYNGKPCTQFRVAVSTAFKDESGQYLTNFVTVSAWNKLAETCTRLTKGQLVTALGSFGVRPYKTRDGKDSFSCDLRADEVQFDPKSSAPVDPFN